MERIVIEKTLRDNLNLHECCDCNFNVHLPVEIIAHIFQYLSYPDRVAASQVCTLWYEASLGQKFLKKEKVVFKMIHSEDITRALNVFEKSNRPYLHYILINIELNKKFQEYWRKMGQGVYSLSMDKCSLSASMFIDMLSNFPNLECLEIIDCRELLMCGQLLNKSSDFKRLKETLTQLKELNIGCNRYLSDILFNRLIAIAPNLESFSLADCPISFHLGLYNRFYPTRLTSSDENYASETVLTFWNILKYIIANARRIKQLDFSKTLIDSKALVQISQVENLNLKELYLVSCEQITNQGLLSVAELQRNLTALNVSYCSRITDPSLIRICSNLLSLKKLGVRNCRAITDLGVAYLKKLEKLEELDLSQCDKVTGAGIEEGLCSRETNTVLKKLYLEGLSTITSDTVIKLAKCLPCVTHLSLSFCFNAVTDKSVQAIIEHQTLIRSLNLVACTALTDAGLTGLGINIENEQNTDDMNKDQFVESGNWYYQRLQISLRSRAENEIVRDAARKKAVQQLCMKNIIVGEQKGLSLRRLKGLQELNLRACNRITDVSLQYAICFPELQHLNLSQCQQITHDGLHYVGINNPGIETLNLAQCYNITDVGIAKLAKSLKRLKILDLQGCSQLTDATKKIIAANCPCLRYLDIRTCAKMSSENMSDVDDMPSIQTFHYTDSRIVRSPSGHSVMEHCYQLV